MSSGAKASSTRVIVWPGGVNAARRGRLTLCSLKGLDKVSSRGSRGAISFILIIQTLNHCRQVSKHPSPHPGGSVSSLPRNCRRIHEESRSCRYALCCPRLSKRKSMGRKDEPAKTSVRPSDRGGLRNCSDAKPGCQGECRLRAPFCHIAHPLRGTRVRRRSPCQASHGYTLAHARPTSGHGPMCTG